MTGDGDLDEIRSRSHHEERVVRRVHPLEQPEHRLDGGDEEGDEDLPPERGTGAGARWVELR